MFYSIIMRTSTVLSPVSYVTTSWKNNRGACAPRQDVKLTKCLVVSSHVVTLKHKVKHEYITWKRLFVCFLKQLKEPLLGCMSVFSFLFYCRYMIGHHVYCIVWQIVWAHMLLHFFQQAVTLATSSSSQDCASCHNNAVEQRICS